MIDDPRMSDGEGQGAHAVISRDPIEVLVKGEEDLVGDGLGIVDSVRAQVAEHPWRQLLVGSGEAFRGSLLAVSLRLVSHHTDFFPGRCRGEPELPVRLDCRPTGTRLEQSAQSMVSVAVLFGRPVSVICSGLIVGIRRAEFGGRSRTVVVGRQNRSAVVGDGARRLRGAQ